MRRLKIIAIAVILGFLFYIFSFNLLMGLKVKGYKYLFRSTEPFDLVIKHAMILDGSGENEKYRADIAVRDGVIEAVGYVNPKNSPVYDAGGLTAIPVTIPIEKTDDTLEHLLSTSYPRYMPQEIYFTEGEYKGLSLLEAAETQGLSVIQTHKNITTKLGPQAKILIIPFEYVEEDTQPNLTQLLARLTGLRAAYFGKMNSGMIKAGFQADINFIKTSDYTDVRLIEVLKKGILPKPLIKLEKGILLSQ